MAVVNAKIDIVNMALGLLGENPVNDTVNTPNGRTMDQWYDISRQAILQENAWRFATQRRSIAAESTPPLNVFSYSYLLPTDTLTLILVGTDDCPQRPNIDYMVENNRILTSQTGPLPIKIIADVTDVSKMPALFKICLAQLLASFTAIPILKSAQKSQELMQLHNDTLINASTVNAIENAPQIVDRSKWRDSQLSLQNLSNQQLF